MNKALIDQISHWLERVDTDSAQTDSALTKAWRSLLENNPDLFTQSDSLQSMMQSLLTQSQVLTGLGEKTDANEPTPHIDLTRLRNLLRHFHEKIILQQAQLPEQLAPLIFTQVSTDLGVLDKFTTLLTELPIPFNIPYFQPLCALQTAFFQWQKSGKNLHSELEHISEQACLLWEQAKGSEKNLIEEQLSLWGACYDDAFREHFASPQMQQAQSDWLNHWANLKITWKDSINQISELAGTPSNLQINSLISQLDQQRRRIRDLEKRLAKLEAERRNE